MLPLLSTRKRAAHEMLVWILPKAQFGTQQEALSLSANASSISFTCLEQTLMAEEKWTMFMVVIKAGLCFANHRIINIEKDL